LLPLALLSRIFGPSVAIHPCILGVFLFARVRIRNTRSLCNTISGLSFASASSSSPKEALRYHFGFGFHIVSFCFACIVVSKTFAPYAPVLAYAPRHFCSASCRPSRSAYVRYTDVWVRQSVYTRSLLCVCPGLCTTWDPCDCVGWRFIFSRVPGFWNPTYSHLSLHFVHTYIRLGIREEHGQSLEGVCVTVSRASL
jgi:hypothetical protein